MEERSGYSVKPHCSCIEFIIETRAAQGTRKYTTLLMDQGPDLLRVVNLRNRALLTK